MAVYLAKMLVHCKYKDACAGCSLLDIPLAIQHKTKSEDLRQRLATAQIPLNGAIEVHSPAPSGLRDRVDLVIEDGSFGLYERNSRKILDIEDCRQLSPALQSWLTDARARKWPVRKGSVRLRVGPHGERGIWLDFANVDIKAILDEQNFLRDLQTLAFVEIGQRRKVPIFNGTQFKLKDPEPQVWFQTWIEDRAVDLYCSIGSFTQTGFIANRELVQVIQTWLNQTDAQKVLEFGSGIGNLSFPALGENRHLTACEIDENALAGFKKSLEHAAALPGLESIQSRVQILAGDFQNKNPQDFERYDAVLANPPRSGLKSFLNPLINAQNKPKHFIYMSCFPESFIEDGQQLANSGYRLQELKIVDQFPQTNHYEILSLWERI